MSKEPTVVRKGTAKQIIAGEQVFVATVDGGENYTFMYATEDGKVAMETPSGAVVLTSPNLFGLAILEPERPKAIPHGNGAN